MNSDVEFDMTNNSSFTAKTVETGFVETEWFMDLYGKLIVMVKQNNLEAHKLEIKNMAIVQEISISKLIFKHDEERMIWNGCDGHWGVWENGTQLVAVYVHLFKVAY
jgi:hypothetical protein